MRKDRRTAIERLAAGSINVFGYGHAATGQTMLRIDSEQEEDGRWIAEVPALPGVMAYGKTKSDASAKAQVLALRVIADRVKAANPYPAKSPTYLKRHEPVAIV